MRRYLTSRLTQNYAVFKDIYGRGGKPFTPEPQAAPETLFRIDSRPPEELSENMMQGRAAFERQVSGPLLPIEETRAKTLQDYQKTNSPKHFISFSKSLASAMEFARKTKADGATLGKDFHLYKVTFTGRNDEETTKGFDLNSALGMFSAHKNQDEFAVWDRLGPHKLEDISADSKADMDSGAWEDMHDKGWK